MKSLNAKVTVSNVSLYTTEEGRQMIALIINESIPARRLDKNTGELVACYANDIKMPLRQFMHIVFYDTATMFQYYLNTDGRERGYYKTMSQTEYYNILVGATLSLTIEKYEDGEEFVNEITGETDSSDGVTFHTRIADIELSKFGDDFAFGEPKDMLKMMQIIDAAKKARHTKFDFATEKAAE